jgi:tight adherence protein C
VIVDSSIWIFVLAVGAASVSLIWAAMATVAAMVSPVRRRLKALREDDGGEPAAAAGTGLSALWRMFEPQKEAEKEGLRLRLVRAGLAPGAVGVVYAAKLVGAGLLPAVTLFVMRTFTKVQMPLSGWAFAGLTAAFVGSLLPDLYLSHRFERRKERLLDGLPDALDLLVTCTEAGLGLNAALERVVEQLPGSHPDLAHELGQVNAEIRVGVERSQALRNLGDRTGLDEIHGLVSLITHSSRLGTGVAGTLRIYAEDFRDRRMQRAEEIAATVGTKLMFPLIFCLFPSFFIVAVGPAIIGVMRALAGLDLPNQ